MPRFLNHPLESEMAWAVVINRAIDLDSTNQANTYIVVYLPQTYLEATNNTSPASPPASQRQCSKQYTQRTVISTRQLAI